MKKYLIFAFVAMSLIFGSCKSTKQEEQVPEQTEQVEKPVEPTEPETPAEPEVPADSFAEQNSKLLETVDASREAAIKSGANQYYADDLAKADAKLKELKEKSANTTADMSKEINDVNYRYLALEKASATKKLKEKIEANGFVDDNRIAYDAAEVLYAELEKAIHESEDGYAMFKAAEGAYAAYHTIFYSSFKKLADKERAGAVEQKKNADSVRAGVSRKDEYKAIVEIFKKGDSAYVTKNPEGAYEKYKEAKEKFEVLYKDVAEKRAAAQKRIDEAKAKVNDVSDFAENADQTAPLGNEKVDGIEEKDTVLLEKDEFANPEDAVIEVEETVDAGNDSTIEVLKDALGVEEK